jgi:Domain of unknown function (DUF4468) with TBP-like fold
MRIKMTFLIFLFFTGFTFLYSQNENLLRTKVLEITGTKSELYNRSLKWLVTRKSSPNENIELEDIETGTIISKRSYIAKGLFGTENKAFYNLVIKVKDNKVKIETSDPYIFLELNSMMAGKQDRKLPVDNKKTIKQYDTAIDKVLSDFETYMNNDKEDDW